VDGREHPQAVGRRRTRQRRRRSTATSPAQVDPALPGTICNAENTGVKRGPRRTQPGENHSESRDDDGTQRQGAAGGARNAPASLCRRFKARERTPATRAASSPPREAPALLLVGGEAKTEGNRSGGGGLGFGWRRRGCCGWGQNPREALRRRLNRPRGCLDTRAQGRERGAGARARGQRGARVRLGSGA
jgi:hypothetical protein